MNWALISQKTTFFIVTAMKALNVTSCEEVSELL
jgi:hypothetical protein